MQCKKCNDKFKESEIHESHNVPTYLFEGNRKGREKQADKFGRKHLCQECHLKYENKLRNFLRTKAFLFSEYYFKREEQDINEVIKGDLNNNYSDFINYPQLNKEEENAREI